METEPAAGRGAAAHPELTMPAYTHPLRTFGDLAAFDLEAVVSCRCGRHGTIDGAALFFRDRPIGGTRFRCTTMLPIGLYGRQCNERHGPTIRRRGRDGWNLPDHWRAMMRRNPGAAPPPHPPRTFRDHVHDGQIGWLHDTGCPAGYSVDMVAFDEPPWDRFLDRPLGAIVCPACRQPMKLSHTCGGHGPGGRKTESLDEEPAHAARSRRRGEHIVITGAS